MGCCGNTAKRFAHGAIQRTRDMLGLDRAAPAVIEARRAICQACPSAIPCRGDIDRKCYCAECCVIRRGRRLCCPLPTKTRLKSERCPLGKW